MCGNDDVKTGGGDEREGQAQVLFCHKLKDLQPGQCGVREASGIVIVQMTEGSAAENSLG